jgi:hypothetical protein
VAKRGARQKGAAPGPAVRCWCAVGGSAADLALPLAGCDATGPRGDGARHGAVAAEEHLEHLECGAFIAVDCLLP